MLTNLNEKFNKQFANYFGELNSKINKIEKTEDGAFEVPVPVLASGGATILPAGPEPVSLDAPAVVTFETKKVKPFKVIYRIAFSLEDAAKAAEDDAYFNYTIIPIVQEAVARYQKTFGNFNTTRYGEVFCTPKDQPFTETGAFVELHLSGCWASNELVGENNAQ